MAVNRVVALGAAVSVFLAGAALAGPGTCIVFFDQQEFEQFNAADGKFLKGIENFEEALIPDGAKQVLPAPLVGNVPNVDPNTGFGFPDGLTEKNIIIQDNTFPGPNPPFANPSGLPQALYVIGQGFVGSNSKKIGEDLEVLTGQSASTDLIFTEPNHTGVGFELSHFAGFGNGLWHISVYNKNDDEICKIIVPDPGINEPSKVFVGVWTPQTIGRINIWDEGIIPDAIDNIQLWEEQAPVCPWDCAVPHDKKIDVVDFLALLGTWGAPGPCDFDGDGAVDVQDFLKLLAQWGNCPAPANDECPGEPITRGLPVGSVEAHFDMYGATPSLLPHNCLDIVPVKDIWYCLTYQAGPPPNVDKLVTVSSSVPLLIEVTAGCACTVNATLLACGFGANGTPQFLMHPGDSVTIRLSNTQNLPNDLLKGNLLIENKLVPPPPHVNLFEDPISFFEAVEAAGKTEKFFWNFKPHVVPPGAGVQLQSPLDINTHGLNPGDPWTSAAGSLWPPSVDNVQFTINVNPQGPLQIAPGANLIFFPAGSPLNNNFLGSNIEPASFDIISGPPAGDNHTAIAFELAVIGGPIGQPNVVHVTVYDKQDLVLAKFPVTVFSGAKHFVGVLSKDPAITIGRIDIWAPAGGYEGITAIWAYRQGAGVNFFLNSDEFFGAVDAAGKSEKFFWNFKPDYLQPGAQVFIPQPLDINTHFLNAPNVWFHPGAANLWPPQVDNVQFWSNGSPQGPFTPGQGLLYYKGGGGLPITNNLLVSAPSPIDTSFDIFSGPPAGDNHTAFAFELMSIGPAAPLLHVTVYDKQEIELGKLIVPQAPPFAKTFLGILSKDPLATIGRIDIWDTHGGQEGISAIAAYSHAVPTALTGN